MHGPTHMHGPTLLLTHTYNNILSGTEWLNDGIINEAQIFSKSGYLALSRLQDIKNQGQTMTYNMQCGDILPILHEGIGSLALFNSVAPM